MTEYTGTGDPRRSLNLLWGLQVRPSRGPKPGLSVEQVVHAAVEVADEEGIAVLSMRSVAQRLGVGTMSLYRYVPNKAELLDLMVDMVQGENRMPDPPPAGWRAQLAAFARVSLAFYHRHPWVLQVSTARPVLGPNVLASFESWLQVLDGIGLTGAEMVAAGTALGGYVRGIARTAIDEAGAAKSTGVSDEQWWADHMFFWEEDMYFDTCRYPTLTKIYQAGAFEQPEDVFEFGLERVLDGIEALIARRDAGPR